MQGKLASSQFDFVPGPEATIIAPQVCTQCQYELAPVVPHDHVYDENGTLHAHSCVCGETYEALAEDCEICATFPWHIVCIVEAVVFAGVLAGLYLWMKKREKSRSTEEPAEQRSEVTTE